MVMKCFNCNVILFDWVLYCPYCGARQPVKPLERKYIVFDKTHYETLRYSYTFIKIAEELGYKIRVLEGEWSKHYFEDINLLTNAAGVILGGIEKWETMSRRELLNLITYVYLGGVIFITPASLLLLEESYRGLNSFVASFGIIYTDIKIIDREHHEGRHEDHVIIHDFATHPLTENVSTVCFLDYGGVSIKVLDDSVKVLAITDYDAYPPGQPVLVLASRGNGWLIGFSCSTTFQEDKYDNFKLARNILKFMMNPVESGSPRVDIPPPPPPPPPPSL